MFTRRGGDLWFADWDSASVGRITPTGVVTMFKVGQMTGPYQVTAGPDGNLWFTDYHSIGRITPLGVVTKFPVCLIPPDPPWAVLLTADLRGQQAVAVRLRCPARGNRGTPQLLLLPGPVPPCRGRLSLALLARDKPAARIGARTFRIAAGKEAKVAVPLWPAGRHELWKQGKPPRSIILVVIMENAAGGPGAQRIVKLPRQPPARD